MSSVNDPSEKELLQIPFDQYQRYKIVQEAVDELRIALFANRASLKILDVGGSPATLKRFLPHDLVLVSDLADQGGLDLYGDGLCLPFTDQAFDLTVSVDTLEHIPPENRSSFLTELIRVTRTAILLAAPFDDPLVIRAEETFQQLLWTHFGEGYDFLEEHRRFGLPHLEQTFQLLQHSEFQAIAIPNGYLHRWLLTIGAFFLLQWRYQDNHLSKIINAYYNSSFYRADNREPSYRKLVVALRSSIAERSFPEHSQLLERISKILCQPAEISGAEEAAHLHALSIMTTLLTESWSRHAIDLQNQLQTLQYQYQEQQYHYQTLQNEQQAFQEQTQLAMQNLESALQKAQAENLQLGQEIHRLETENQQFERRNDYLSSELSEIHGSTAWKLIQFLWRMRLKLIPHDSRRERLMHTLAHPNRALRRLYKRDTLLLPSDPASTPVQTVSQEDIPASLLRPPSDFDIIIFPIIDWDFRFQRPQHLAQKLATNGRRVFYIRTAFASHSRTRLTAMPNVIEVTLPGNPNLILYKDLLDADTQELATVALSALRDRFEIRQAILLVNLPFWYPLAARLKELYGWKLVYDCLDYHAGFENISSRILELENRLSAESDLVLATSHKLFSLQSQQSHHCLLLPNAGDYHHFHTQPSQIPSHLRNLSHPIIGYYGAISSWFDAPLVAGLARQRPNWSFVLIGNTWGSDLSSLKGLANIHTIDEIPYSELPAYLHAFDTCFIPFRKTPLTDATNPVKLFEYLSAGKPVVASDLDELRNYRQYVHLATPETWLTLLEQSLRENSPEMVSARTAFASQNTWEHRATQLDQALRQLYPPVSILILTYNQLDYTKQCLQSVFEHTHYPNYEIIIVDNKSVDETPAYLQSQSAEHPNLKIILNQENAGFARANNQAAAVSQGEYLVFLNNDTIVTPGWLGGLLQHLQDPQVGLVGPVTNEIANESKIAVPYTEITDLNAFAAQLARQKAGRSFELRVAALFCAVMRRKDFLAIGGLDERYGIGMFEDDDLAESLHQRGLKIICAENAFVHHWGRGGFKQMPYETYLQIFEENRLKFEKKWGKSWMQHSQA